MLRVGLTGGLGSGKSTAGAMLAAMGAHVVLADEIGRALMAPGQAVFAAVVERFGPGVLAPDGGLDRAALARMAFGEGRLPELNAIVHPAVIAHQAQLADALEQNEPDAVLVVESALLFETEHGGPDGWRTRFDRVVLLVAEEQLRVDRFVQRVAAVTEAARKEARMEARRRIARQKGDAEKAAQADFVIRNEGSIEHLREQIERVWEVLARDAKRRPQHGETGGVI